MAGILDYGVGAFNGQRLLREDRLKDAELQRLLDQTNETHRSNVAEEDYRNRDLQERTAYRILQQQQLDDSRKAAQEDRDNALAVRTIEMTPMGASISPQNYDSAVRAGVPPSIFDVREIGGHLGDGSPGGDQGPTIDRNITNLGTQTQRMNTRRQDFTEYNAGEVNADRDAARRDSEFFRYYQPTPIQLPGGGIGYAPRPEVAGATIPPWAQQYAAQGGPRGGQAQAPAGTPAFGTGQAPQQQGSVAPGGVTSPFRAPDPASQRVQSDEMRNNIEFAQAVLDKGKKTGWAGIGPVAGSAGDWTSRKLPTALGGGPEGAVTSILGGGGTDGQDLRNMVGDLFASGLFAEGGKNLTATEKALAGRFRASIDTNPAAAEAALQELVDSMNRRLGNFRQTGPGPAATQLPDVPPQAGESVLDRLNRRAAAARGR